MKRDLRFPAARLRWTLEHEKILVKEYVPLYGVRGTPATLKRLRLADRLGRSEKGLACHTMTLRDKGYLKQDSRTRRLRVTEAWFAYAGDTPPAAVTPMETKPTPEPKAKPQTSEPTPAQTMIVLLERAVTEIALLREALASPPRRRWYHLR